MTGNAQKKRRKLHGSAPAVLLLLFLLAPAVLSATSHEVVYLEGYPYKRSKEGDEYELEIGAYVQTGETVITGRDETVELEAEGYKVIIDEKTVFSLMEIESRGKKTDVLSCALGKLSFSRDKILGTEPRLATNSAVCGVRGTNVALLAGADGSSLIVVEEGRVQVEAAGESIELAANEGVEVITGSAPGERFSTLERQIDYSGWNEERLAAFSKEPVQTALNIERQMDDFIAEIRKITPLYQESMDKLEEERAIIKAKKEEGEPYEDYYREVVQPLEKQTTFYILNLRYYSLSGLSLRRFVLSRLYMKLKYTYITDPANPLYVKFLDVHRRILEKYDKEIALPYLVKADI